jgi:hypothetical protein
VYKNLTILLRKLFDNNIHLQFLLYHKTAVQSALAFPEHRNTREICQTSLRSAYFAHTSRFPYEGAYFARICEGDTGNIYICALSSLSNVQHHTSAFTSSSSLTSSTTQTLSSLLSRLLCERVWHRQLTTHHPRFLGLCLIVRHKTLLMQGLGRNRLPQPI